MAGAAAGLLGIGGWESTEDNGKND